MELKLIKGQAETEQRLTQATGLAQETASGLQTLAKDAASALNRLGQWSKRICF